MRGACLGGIDGDPEATILSIDGISAYDLISRRAKLTGLARVDGGGQVVPFVKLFCGAPPYWWEDELGNVHVGSMGRRGARRCNEASALLCRAT